MNMAIALAQKDPVAARQLLATLTGLTRSEATYQRIRDDLIALGVPNDHLPPTLAEHASARPATPETDVTSPQRWPVQRT